MKMQTNLIRRIKMITAADNFIPVENMVKDMENLEQFAKIVVNYTSKYNNSFSINYAPENIVGKYAKYPYYGDFTETYILRSYGKWWRTSEAALQPYMLHDIDPYGAEDYITLRFQSAVVPRHVFIYETYNPGAVVRIWGRYAGKEWKLLWEGAPQSCAEESRKFSPQLRKINCLINELRLEFNQSHLKYFTSIDAVLLSGFQPKHMLQYNLLQKDLEDWIGGDTSTATEFADESTSVSTGQQHDGVDFFGRLPHEVIVQIFQNLDLKSLSRCAQVNKKWCQITHDPILYYNLSLQHYWHRFNVPTLAYFMHRCHSFRKIDLNWCCAGDLAGGFAELFIELLASNCRHATHLSLNHCDFARNGMIEVIAANCCDLKELRLRSSPADRFHILMQLNKLVLLDLCYTQIADNDLIAILMANPLLKHLNLDLCENLKCLDKIVEVVVNYNKHLTTWSSWKTRSLTALGAALFANCPKLRELDLGWCLMLSYPGDCLEKIANGCRDMRRLIISQWRGVNDQLLLPIVNNCKNLTQLDLLGVKGITTEICEMILLSLPKLKLLDISFCDSVSNEKVCLFLGNSFLPACGGHVISLITSRWKFGGVDSPM